MHYLGSSGKKRPPKKHFSIKMEAEPPVAQLEPRTPAKQKGSSKVKSPKTLKTTSPEQPISPEVDYSLDAWLKGADVGFQDSAQATIAELSKTVKVFQNPQASRRVRVMNR